MGTEDTLAGQNKKPGLYLLALGALGVVYGDIGTSPLYALRECFHEEFGLAPTPDNVIGLCSLIIWSLIFVVIVKYVHIVMKADNKGEGGILSLLALLTPQDAQGRASRWFRGTMIVALIGTALLGADGTITPAVTVLSAIEGLEVATPGLTSFVIPITVIILFLIFRVQKHGTGRISSIFGPAMLVWFLSIAALGLPPIFKHPGILAAVNPFRGYGVLLTHGWRGFLVLGAVVLCVTGAEALYADMGHFGRRAISMAWYPIVFPCLIINYLGQGANIITQGPGAAQNPFYALTNGITIYPMVVIATIAAVIASQALISGSFSLAQQAIQLGYSPRLTIVHTSEHAKGQIYCAEINFLLMVACIALVFMFRSSTNLAGAYGIAVVGTMTITSLLIFEVSRHVWRWPTVKSIAALVFMLAIDIPFLVANLPKIAHGGWFPIMICLGVYSIMVTWKRGRGALLARMQRTFRPVGEFVAMIAKAKPYRVPGTAIFMTSNPRVIPPALEHHWTHNQVLHGQVLLLSIVTADVPSISLKDVLEVTPHGEGFYEVVAHYGFMQTPRMDRILRLLRIHCGVVTDESKTTYYLGRDSLLTDGPERMARWRKKLFAFLLRNSVPATAYYGIPADRVVELGMQVNL